MTGWLRARTQISGVVVVDGGGGGGDDAIASCPFLNENDSAPRRGLVVLGTTDVLVVSWEGRDGRA